MDTISRQAAIDAIMADKIEGKALDIIIALGDGKQAETLNQACDRHAQLLNDLPSAEPTQANASNTLKALDCISRQAALDAISCNITVTGRQNAELVAATIGTFADRIKALPSAQPELQWIPVAEKPIEKGLMLVTYNDGDVDLLKQPTAYRRSDIVAWMPIESWRGAEHETD